VTTTDVELVLDARAELGEGPVWDGATRSLLWVDISRGLVHRFDPTTARDEAFDVGRPVGAAVPTASGGLAIAAHDGFALVDPETGDVELVAELETDRPETTMNDGACDPAGRFWAGTKDVGARRPIGSLYRLDADHRVTRVLPDVTLSNGLGWSPDGRAMYYIDSTTYRVDGFTFDPETGDVGDRRVVVELPEEWGLPDGLTVDEEGMLWVAFWGGSAIRRIAPDGSVTGTVTLPVTQVTSCAFGGEGLADLYVTSARVGLTDEELRRQPNAGGLLRLRPGVRGLPSAPFAG
jgi:sugar lactone lactonase YvrE